MQNQEIEVRFLEIDAEELKEKLKKLGAKDLGEDFLREHFLKHLVLWLIADRRRNSTSFYSKT